jgi:hypothetical protein
MCSGFGIIIDKKLDLWFAEPDLVGDCSHTTILKRKGIVERSSVFTRPFVRVQYPGWSEDNFEFDELETLPSWALENGIEIHQKCDQLLGRCRAAYFSFAETIRPFRVQFEAINSDATLALRWVRTSCWSDDKLTCLEQSKKYDEAIAQYRAIIDPAFHKFMESAREPLKVLVQSWSSIPGFVPPPEDFDFNVQ